MNKRLTSVGEKNKRANLKNLFLNSLFFRILIFLSDFIYKKIKYSKIAQFLSSYGEFDELRERKSDESVLKKLWLKPKTRLLIKNKIQHSVESSWFYRSYLRIIDYLLGAKAKVFGTVIFIYGFCSASIGLIKTFVSVSADEDYFLIIQGAVLLIVGLIFTASKNTLGNVLANSRALAFLIKNVIGYNPDKLIKKPVGDNSTVIPVIIGFFLGISSLLIDPLYILVAFFAFVYVSVIFSNPEFGILLTIFFIPFFPTMLLCGQIILVFLAYFCKLMRGKRSLRFSKLDIAVAIFAILLFLGGIFSASVSTSLPAVCVFICFMLSYFLVVNLVRTVALLKKVLYALGIALFFCAFIGVWQNFFGVADTTWTDVDMFSDIETRVVSTFENPNVFGEYLIMMLPIVLAMFFVEKSIKRKSAFALSGAFGLMALIFTWSRGAWLGFIIAMVLYFLVVNKRSISVYLLGLIALPFAYPFFPESIRSRIESIGNMADSSTSYRVHIWEAAWNMLKDWWLTGIGVGVGAFREIYPSYSLAGIETAPHSHNLFFQIFLELGIFGFVAFLAVIVIAIRKCCSYLAHGNQRDVKLISFAAIVGILAILAQGLTDHVWYNYRVFLMFWIVLSVASVSIDISMHEYRRTDDIEGYIAGGKNEKAEIHI